MKAFLMVAGVGLSQCAAGVFTERSGVTYDLRVILAALVLHKSPTSKQKTLSHESVLMVAGVGLEPTTFGL